MSTFGFEIKSGGGDFMPIVRYDAKAGRFFRDDKSNDGSGFVKNPVDITAKFKCLADFENAEVGWMSFAPGTPPSFVLVRRDMVKNKTVAFPAQPNDNHKSGVRFILKLAPDIGGERPIREISSTAGTFLNGWKEVFDKYDEEKAAHPGLLPVIMVDKETPTVPVTTGSGARQSTNYQPKLHLVGWAPRGDLVPNLRSTAVQTVQTPVQTVQTNGHAPVTGSQRAPAPQQAAVNHAADFASDFG